MSTGDHSLQPPADGISAVVFSPDSTRLLVSSWDGSIQLHHLVAPPQPPAIFPHPAAVLAICFGSSPTIAFSGGLDKRVRQWDFETGQTRVLGKHDDAISCMVWSAEYNVLITGSWDSTIKVWDPSAEIPLRSTQTLPSRVYNLSLAASTSTLLVSMAHRHVYVYKLPELAAVQEGQPLRPSQERESALKFMTRSVACMIDGKGWASGSIEGRIAVEYFDPDPATQSQKYAFRAHRQQVDGVDCVYPINALAYHPVHNTFASGGSDGFISIWDHSAKKRMKLYPKYPTSISSLAFSPDGSKLAIGASYEHDNAVNEHDRGTIMLLVKDTVMEDCKPKAKA
ncbi:WD40-repeat-containing domain protein [Naematelia encephala]|uniref:WD40-repeat-containing domain protein n=1 Tax=Naematelia encephala TaxID=71784 RepID=A0A1Y2BJE9_9TREE|nr:WD40-repeat-containing domain protein [Naematelia encephala]